jgi:hypothetical protein
MTIHFRNSFVRAVTTGAFAVTLLLPAVASAQTEHPTTGTLVGAVTCGDAAVTPAANAIISVPGSSIETRTSGDGRFELTNVPTGFQVTVDAASDLQGTSGTSRYGVVAVPGQTLDIGSMDISVCPAPSTPHIDVSEREMEERGNPTD